MTRTKRKQLDGCQVLRVLAFLGIFLSHAGLGPFASFGAWGVSVFVILSGFLMVYNHYGAERDSCFHSAWSHIKKLYPLHIMMLILCVCLRIYGIVIHHSKVDHLLAQVILHLTLTQAWIPKSEYYFSLNGVSWFLSMCLVLYFVFPWIMKRIESYSQRRDPWIYIGLSFTSLLAFSLLFRVTGAQDPSDLFSIHWLTYVFPVYRIGDFVIGCNLGYLFITRREEKRRRYLNSIGEIAALALIVAACYCFQRGISFLGDEHIKSTLLFLPANALFIWLFAENEGVLSSLLTGSWIVRFGSLCSYCFLIHQMAIGLVGAAIQKLFPTAYSTYVAALLAFVVTLIGAEIYKNYIDPFCRKLFRHT